MTAAWFARDIDLDGAENRGDQRSWFVLPDIRRAGVPDVGVRMAPAGEIENTFGHWQVRVGAPHHRVQVGAEAWVEIRVEYPGSGGGPRFGLGACGVGRYDDVVIVCRLERGGARAGRSQPEQDRAGRCASGEPSMNHETPLEIGIGGTGISTYHVVYST